MEPITPRQLKSKIRSGNSTDWFQNHEETIYIPYIGFETTFKGAAALYDFCYKQINEWKKKSSELPAELTNSVTFFEQIAEEIVSHVSNYHDRGQYALENRWEGSISSLIENYRSFYPFTFHAPEVDFLLKVHESKPDSFRSAFRYLTDQNRFDLREKDEFTGMLLAYEFQNKDDSILFQRRKIERSGLATLRNQFEQSVSDSVQEIDSHITESEKKFKEHANKIDELADSKGIEFTEWFTGIKESFDNFDGESKGKMDDLNKTYAQLLKLQKPADYWSQKGKELKRQGWIALGIMVALVIGVSWTLGEILWTAPEQLYASFFDDDKSAAIRWSIIYVTLISFLAFCIRILAKVMLSSFHLARDAEERHTLTYFYLSLLKEAEIDKEQVQLIMQSLFSRAETGLLKSDASPTMPSDVVSRYFGGIRE